MQVNDLGFVASILFVLVPQFLVDSVHPNC
jgi:photosystem II reaction center protein PsbM